MAKVIFILISLVTYSTFAQGDRGGGGPSIILNSASSETVYDARNAFGELFNSDRGGGPARTFDASVLMGFGETPAETTAPLKVDWESFGVDGGGGVHSRLGTSGNAADLFGFNQTNESKRQAQELLNAMRFNSNASKPKLDLKKFLDMSKDYTYLGKLLDVETRDHGVMDRETLIDTKPEWMNVFQGNIWVKKDAPIINYQTDEGEVVDFFKID